MQAAHGSTFQASRQPFLVEFSYSWDEKLGDVDAVIDPLSYASLQTSYVAQLGHVKVCLFLKPATSPVETVQLAGVGHLAAAGGHSERLHNWKWLRHNGWPQPH